MLKRSLDRILTTHAGALPRPEYLLGAPADEATVARAVGEAVAKQTELGIDSINDGEYGKPNFVYYMASRMSGLESMELAPGEEHPLWLVARREEQLVGDYFRRRGGVFVRQGRAEPLTQSVCCMGAVKYVGQEAIRREIAHFRAALQQAGEYEEAFLPAPSPGIITLTTIDRYYHHDEQYRLALAEALREEYLAIVDAGFVLQVDAPDIVDDWQRFEGTDVAAFRKHMERNVEILNHALRGIPAEQVRFHTCWGSWHGPHVADLPLEEFIDVLFKVNANALSIEASNPRHEHEWQVFEKTKLPDGKFLVPGVVGHFTDFVEHPRLIAERLVRYAGVVGRENVVAGTDCGLYRVGHPVVAWEKFRALVEGARLATEQLWIQ